MIKDDEVLKEFLVESYENLDQLDRDFVALEADPTARDRIAAIFRTIHTIKGTAGFLGFSRLETLTHSGESVLSLLRDGALTLTPALTSVLLEMVDRVRAMLRTIEATSEEGNEPFEDVLGRLNAFKDGTGASTQASAPEPMVLWLAPNANSAGEAAAEPAPAPPEPEVAAKAPEPPAASAPARSSERAKPAEAAAPESAAPEPAAPEPTAAAPAASTRGEEPPQSSAASGAPVADSSVRVDVGLLDKLMNLVGELVLARNQIVQFGARIEDPGFISASQRLNHVATELQEHVMKTRMQPIGNVWSKLPRVVRDLAVTCGKQVRIEMIGKQTELDRTILEAIKDPLTHAVRNAVDHGIEAPEVRASRGKAKTGTLMLRAFHEGGQVNIEISDDGAGLKVDAIRKKAIERNLVTAERAARMTDRDLCQLIFLPGFSTAAAVTNVSGRGVGMDVVKTNIEKIGGTVDLLSTPGVGTTIKIKIPLTLAIVPALIVSSADQRYAIPQVNLLELVRLEGDQVKSAIERVHGTPVYRLRGRLLPIVFLNEQLERAQFSGDELSHSINIVVLQADERQFGLVVDDVRDTEEIVVKPLGKELKGISVFAGAAIMGDGRVALIIDVIGLAQHAGAIGEAKDQAKGGAGLRAESSLELRRGDERQALLVFAVGEDSVMALPLSMVARLEEFSPNRLENVRGRRVVQYRGEILSLIDLSETGGGMDNGSVHVIVYSEGDRSVGFVVSRIIDVVEDVVHIDTSTAQSGILGAAVIGGKVTSMLDVQGVIRSHDPSFFEGRAA
jgi:two-component system, chemotaxis family, sensor kinase CheA